jgi:hypothetical protein
MRANGVVLHARQQGNVLLLSLFILSAILFSATTIAALVIRDVRTARIFDDGHAALYAAESGIEQALYAIRRQNADPLTQNGGSTLSNGATLVRQVQTGETLFTEAVLREGDFVDLDLFVPDSLGTPPGIEALSFSWDDTCGNCSTLELSYVQWPVGANISWPPGGAYVGTFWKFRQPRSAGVPWVKFDTISGMNNYRLRIRAIAGDIVNLHVRAFADDAATIPIDMPSRVTITSTGTAGTATQSLRASMQRAAPLTGVFQYVLFSEDPLVK